MWQLILFTFPLCAAARLSSFNVDVFNFLELYNPLHSQSPCNCLLYPTQCIVDNTMQPVTDSAGIVWSPGMVNQIYLHWTACLVRSLMY